MITRATPDDLPFILALGERNYYAANGIGQYSKPAAERFLRDVVFSRGAVFLSHGGMIGGVLCPRWAAPDVVEAVEMMWFAEDGQGAALLAHWCDYAQQSGAVPVVTTRKLPPRVARRLGLEASETIYRGG